MADIEISRDVHGFPGAAIDVEAIERELSSLWQVPPAADARESAFPTRTSVLNLVVYAATPEIQRRVSRTVADLAAHHPSRVLIFAVTDDPRAFEGDIDARVTAHCHTETADRFASCYEQVVIAAPPDALDYLPSIIAPLVLPDLPTFVWWPGQPPLQDRRFLAIAGVARRLIVDSLEFTRCAPSLVRLADLSQRVGPACSLADLSWARLRHWQEVAAQCFDLPDFRWALDHVTRCSLVYGHARGAPDNVAQAALFAGWMANRLGWQVDGAERWGTDTWVFTARQANGPEVSIELRRAPCPRHLNGYLMGATIAASDGHRSASVEALRVGDLNTIRVSTRADGEPRLERAVHGPPPEPASLMVPELQVVGHDVMYEGALQEARRVAEPLRARSRA